MQVEMKRFFETYNIKEKVIAAAVSGGADSLALALRLHECGKKVIALTVDHKLRPESTQEALLVQKLMQKYDIEHHILTWKDNKPSKGIEEAARQARYQLMIDFCHQHKIKYLALGHHRRDQAETFLLRLARGSGVYGLSGILPVTERNGIQIIRPQLNDNPDDLRTYLKNKKISWVEDPMNQDEDFARVKIRKFLPRLAEICIDEARLSDTAATLARTRNFIQSLVDTFIKTKVRWWENTVASLSWEALKKCPEEISLNVLGQLIQKVGFSAYIPESTEILRVLAQGADFKGCTLGNCELLIATKRLWILPEDKENTLLSKQEWDNFVDRHPKYKNAGLPYKVRRAIKTHIKD